MTKQHKIDLSCSCCNCGTVSNIKSANEEKASLDCPKCGIVEKILSATEKNRINAANKYPGPSEFVHLHNHTLYSPLDGIATPEEYMIGCAEANMPAFAITDHGTMASFPDAYFAAKKNKIKFIPGIEAYLCDYQPEFKEFQSTREFVINGEKRSDLKMGDLRNEVKEVAERFTRARHLTIHAKNQIGYKNLLKLAKISWDKGYYRRPRMWYDLLRKHKEGLLVLSGCLNGPVCHELRNNNEHVYASKTIRERLNGSSHLDKDGMVKPPRMAIEWIEQFREDFGNDFYLEAQMPGEEIPNGRKAFNAISALSRRMGIPAVVTNDCHYLQRSDFLSQKIMLATDQGKTIDDPDLFHVNSDEQFFKTRAQLRETFIENQYTKYCSMKEFEQYCDNTLEIAEKCDGFQPDLTPKLPGVDDPDKTLVKKCWDALKQKRLNEKPEYVKRMKVELKRFIEKKFSSYFLITQEIVNYSKSAGYPIGPSRGSAGGSLVCYLLGITELDPIGFNLSFDRFLSPSRGGYMMNVRME